MAQIATGTHTLTEGEFVEFTAEEAGRRRVFRVSREAIADHLRLRSGLASRQALHAAFVDNQDRILRAASRKMNSDDAEPILITAADLRRG